MPSHALGPAVAQAEPSDGVSDARDIASPAAIAPWQPAGGRCRRQHRRAAAKRSSLGGAGGGAAEPRGSEARRSSASQPGGWTASQPGGRRGGGGFLLRHRTGSGTGSHWEAPLARGPPWTGRGGRAPQMRERGWPWEYPSCQECFESREMRSALPRRSCLKNREDTVTIGWSTVVYFRA